VRASSILFTAITWIGGWLVANVDTNTYNFEERMRSLLSFYPPGRNLGPQFLGYCQVSKYSNYSNFGLLRYLTLFQKA